MFTIYEQNFCKQDMIVWTIFGKISVPSSFTVKCTSLILDVGLHHVTCFSKENITRNWAFSVLAAYLKINFNHFFSGNNRIENDIVDV